MGDPGCSRLLGGVTRLKLCGYGFVVALIGAEVDCLFVDLSSTG